MQVKSYDVGFVIPEIPVNRPSGGLNIVFQLTYKLTVSGFSVVLISLRDGYNFLEKYVDKNIDKPHKNSIRRIKDLTVKSKFGQEVTVPLLRAKRKVDYDFSILNDVPIYYTNYPERISFKIGKVVATFWMTSYFVHEYARTVGSDGYYFIQNSEDDIKFSGKYHKYAEKSYELPLKKIVINDYMLRRFTTDNPLKIPIGISSNFFTDTRYSQLTIKTVLFQLRKGEDKGAKYGIGAIKILYDLKSSIKIVAFGDIPPEEVPIHTKYHYKPSDYIMRELYKNADIFVLPSLMEGMPAPPLEAMASGCAVIATKIPGTEEYIENEKNGIIVPIKSPEDIALAVQRVLNDKELFLRLITNGRHTANSYTYERMFEKFLEAIELRRKEPFFI